jgi:hypothetical protein
MGVADLYFGVTDAAVRAGHSHNFRGAKDRLVKINRLG